MIIIKFLVSLFIITIILSVAFWVIDCTRSKPQARRYLVSVATVTFCPRSIRCTLARGTCILRATSACVSLASCLALCIATVALYSRSQAAYWSQKPGLLWISSWRALVSASSLALVACCSEVIFVFIVRTSFSVCGRA